MTPTQRILRQPNPSIQELYAALTDLGTRRESGQAPDREYYPDQASLVAYIDECVTARRMADAVRFEVAKRGGLAGAAARMEARHLRDVGTPAGCPNCGSNNWTETQDWDEEGNDLNQYFVSCNECFYGASPEVFWRLDVGTPPGTTPETVSTGGK